MRQVITDHARKRRSAKRGGDWSRVDLGTIRAGSSVIDVDVMALDDALTQLAELNERQSRIVEMRFLGGLTVKEAAQVLGVSLGPWNSTGEWPARGFGSISEPRIRRE